MDRIVKKFPPFILGFCKCGCGQEIEIRDQHHRRMRWYSKGHNKYTDLNKFRETKMCECGCGETILKYFRNGTEIQYKKGHGQSRENHHNWKGGRYLSTDNYWYVLCRGHPNATKGGYVREHRLVVEKKIGRYLVNGEEVHHIDGNTMNNRETNLHLYKKGDHSRLTNIKDLSGYSCFLCGSMDTYIQKHNNRPHWYKYGENKDKRICNKCFCLNRYHHA